MATQRKSHSYTLGHKSQPQGKSVGVPKNPVDNLPKGGGSGPHQSQPQGHGMNIPTRPVTTKSTGATREGNGAGIFKSSGNINRNSGVAGAHRLGCKK